MRFFFDNNMAPSHAEAISALSADFGASAVHLKNRFQDRSVKDEIWLSELGKEGNWVVISNDHRIWKTPHLREAWRKSGLTVFFFVDSWGNLPYWEKAIWLVRAWPQVLQVAKAVAPGAAYEVKRPPRPLVQLRA